MFVMLDHSSCRVSISSMPGSTGTSIRRRVHSIKARVRSWASRGEVSDDDSSDLDALIVRAHPIQIPLKSSGRGGLGNVRRSGDLTESRGLTQARAQEILEKHHRRAYSTGRGGAGNIRRPVSSTSSSREFEVIRVHKYPNVALGRASLHI
ncbi:hypothetical protein C8J56DRAFT_539597 [Mycena floridula]|nr:hypothetical protein C8J56DRAFT_539597 [Mycena floridula]